jgi:hypothetical protein
MDKLDATTTPQLSATQAQPVESEIPAEVRQLFENVGAGGENRTLGLGIMRPSLYH